MRTLVVIGLSLALAAGIAGCGKKDEVKVDPDAAAAEAEARRKAYDDSVAAARAAADEAARLAAEEAARRAAAAVPPLTVADIYFDYDKAALTDAARSTMATNAAGLSTHAGARIVIEGHCDQRGSNEYNLALGERRAAAVKDYLTNYGIDASRLQTVSYGEERPFVTGSDESSWAQNRRAHFVVEE
jgi:peptidoglycan-associated lipoprotein